MRLGAKVFGRFEDAVLFEDGFNIHLCHQITPPLPIPLSVAARQHFASVTEAIIALL